MKSKKIPILLVTLMLSNFLLPISYAYTNEKVNSEVEIELNYQQENVSNMRKFTLESHEYFEEYKEAIKIPTELIKNATANGGHSFNSVPLRAVDNNVNTHWETKKANSDSFKNEFTVEFTENVNIDKMTYKIRSSTTGFLNKYEIYGSKTSSGDDFELIAKGSGETTKDTVEIAFDETEVKRVKIVFLETLRGWASIAELGFYNDPVMKKVNSVFEDNLYTTISQEYNSIEALELLENDILNHPFQAEFLDTINLAKDILNGVEINKTDIITLSQRGNENNDKARIGQRFAGGNLDLTGYYIMPGESIEVYLDANEDDILPQVVFAQVGEVDTRSSNYKVDLKPGKNVITAPVDFTKPFAVYLTNKALPSEQEYAPKVVLKGDVLKEYPIYIDGVTDVAEYIEEVRNHTGANMTDVAGERFLISARNTEAQIAYVQNGATPKDLAREMNNVITLYNKISGLDYNDENPLHHPASGQYHMKFTNEGMLYASNEYTHYSWNTARNMLSGNLYQWGFLHEFAHQMESIQMMLGEVTTNIYTMGTYLNQGINNLTYESVQKDMIDPFLVTGEGGYYDFTYGGKLMVIYQIINYFGLESYADAYRALREDLSKYEANNREQRFIIVMSDVTGYNLAPHFEKYNFVVDEETKLATSKYKTLDKKIEYTRISAQEMIEENIQTFTGGTKAVVEDIQRISDGFELKLGTSDKNQGTIAYEIFRDDKLVGIARNNKFIDIVDSTNMDTVYNYEVVAYDYRVNESIKSDVINSSIGFKPVIKVDNDVIIELNTKFNPIEYVRALNYNNEEIDINNIRVVSNSVDTSKNGIYEVVYEVEDLGFTVSKTMLVEVVSGYSYVSDTEWVSATTGFGEVKKDETVNSANNIRLKVKGEIKEFEKGIAIVPNSEIVYDLSGSDYEYFTSYIGADENYNYSQTSMIYSVLVDEKEVYKSDIFKNDSEAEFIKVDIKGASELKLVVNDSGNGILGDFSAWADAKFISNNTKPELLIDENITLKVGETIENVAGEISAIDKEDGDITSKVVVEVPEINFNKPGEYTLVYKVTDSDNNTVIKERYISIIDSRDYVYLTDYNWTTTNQSYGDPVKDANIVNGNSIMLTGEEGTAIVYERGIGAHATSTITYDLSDKNYEYFTSYVGVDRVMYGRGATVSFEVYVDDKKMFDSGLMASRDTQKFIEVSLAGAKELKLVVTDGGNGIGQDHASWGDTKLYFANVERADATILEEIIKEAKIIDVTEYSEESIVNLNLAIEEAENLLLLDFINSVQVNEAKIKIENAIRDLANLDEVVTIEDKYLLSDIKRTLNIKDDTDITVRDMRKLISLEGK